MPERTCSVEGCTKAHRARGLCSTHYNQANYTADQRHTKAIVPCGWCHKPTSKDKGREKRYGGLFCSLACRDAQRARKAEERKLPVLYLGQVIRPKPPAPRQPAPRLFVAGICDRCGSAFIAEDYTGTARYCSRTCSKRVSKHRYRARKKDAYVADVSPRRIYERDGWRCKLCRKKVRRDAVVPHPLAPVIDHIMPLACGGTHEPANVQCAHFICNSKKSDGVGYSEQLMLIG